MSQSGDPTDPQIPEVLDAEIPDALPADIPEALPVDRGWTRLAWAVIVIVVAVIVILPYYRHFGEPEDPEQKDPVGMVVLEVQARWILGVRDYLLGNLSGQKPTASLRQQIVQLNTGTIEQRLGYVTLVGELEGPGEALAALDDLERKIERFHVPLSPERRQLLRTLRRLYRDYVADRWDAPSLTDDARRQLVDELGWFGKLALAPENGADVSLRQQIERQTKRSFWTILSVVAIAVFLFVIGLVVLILVIIMMSRSRPADASRTGLRCGTGHGGIYAETFALWLLVFTGLQLAAGLLSPPDWGLWPAGLALFASLIVLVWPVIRGIRWQQVRTEVGLFRRSRPWLEPLIGVATYVMGVPILAVGLILTLILVMVQQAALGGSAAESFGPTGGPSHPIVARVAHGEWWVLLEILIIASVIAPIVEETMFRGVFYRHLREATYRYGRLVSFFVSALIVSILFAAIHPQGLVAVPALAALAFAFTIAREWRGSLVACMVAHGINNALVLTMLTLMTT